jgi:L-ascorbate metabolism protein UlaG (beta-lactamase superfamily)
LKFNITHIDTACIIIEINGYKIITDPVLDKAGKLYHHGFGSISRKTDNPALQKVDLNNIDLVLLSHHQHKDNLDRKGKELALTAPLIITTKAASKVFKNAVGLDNWESQNIKTDKVKNLKITATPAQHHPSWLPEFFAGKVIGFILEFDGQENGAIYISGDTVYFNGINEIASRFKIDLGIFHVGGVEFRYLSGFGKYTMNSDDLLKSVNVLKPERIIPIHYRGWTHFKEPETKLKQTIASNILTKDKTIFLVPGIAKELL